MLSTDKLLELIKVKAENELTKTDNLVEMCGTNEDDLEGYTVVVPYETEEELIDIIAGSNKLAKNDFRNKLKMSSSLQAVLLSKLEDEEDDTEFDSLTEMLMFKFGTYQKVLNNFGIETEEEEIDETTYGSPFTEQLVGLNNEEPEEEFVDEIVTKKVVDEKGNIYTLGDNEESDFEEEYEEEYYENEEDSEEINQQNFTSENHKEVYDKDRGDSINISREDYNKLLMMFQLLCDKMGVKFKDVEEEVEVILESEANPYLTLEEVEEVLNLLTDVDRMDAIQKDFILRMYQQGSVKEVTELLNKKIKDCAEEGLFNE